MDRLEARLDGLSRLSRKARHSFIETLRGSGSFGLERPKLELGSGSKKSGSFHLYLGLEIWFSILFKKLIKQIKPTLTINLKIIKFTHHHSENFAKN